MVSKKSGSRPAFGVIVDVVDPAAESKFIRELIGCIQADKESVQVTARINEILLCLSE